MWGLALLERCRYQAVQRIDHQGIRWQGVSLRQNNLMRNGELCASQHEVPCISRTICQILQQTRKLTGCDTQLSLDDTSNDSVDTRTGRSLRHLQRQN
jgi:hypothetical protein